MTDGLQKLFGSPARVKLLRLFLFNPRQSFALADVVHRARVSSEEARKELRLFETIELIKRASRGKGIRYALNDEFEYVIALQHLLVNAPARGEDIVGRIRNTGTLKFVVLSGIFVGEWDASLDLLVVGDRIKEPKLREQVRKLEAEIGKEVRFALLSTQDFFYRLNLNDKLIRDVLDYPHQIVLDRLDIGLK